jgi:hypothetical protein
MNLNSYLLIFGCLRYAIWPGYESIVPNVYTVHSASRYQPYKFDQNGNDIGATGSNGPFTTGADGRYAGYTRGGYLVLERKQENKPSDVNDIGNDNDIDNDIGNDIGHPLSMTAHSFLPYESVVKETVNQNEENKVRYNPIGVNLEGGPRVDLSHIDESEAFKFGETAELVPGEKWNDNEGVYMHGENKNPTLLINPSNHQDQQKARRDLLSAAEAKSFLRHWTWWLQDKQIAGLGPDFVQVQEGFLVRVGGKLAPNDQQYYSQMPGYKLVQERPQAPQEVINSEDVNIINSDELVQWRLHAATCATASAKLSGGCVRKPHLIRKVEL